MLKMAPMVANSPLLSMRSLKDYEIFAMWEQLIMRTWACMNILYSTIIFMRWQRVRFENLRLIWWVGLLLLTPWCCFWESWKRGKDEALLLCLMMWMLKLQITVVVELESAIVGLGGRGTNANKLKQYCTCGDNWEWRTLYNGFVNYYTIY